MPLGLIISLSVTLILLVLSFLFKVAGKLRLTLPLIYFLLVSSILNKWAASHETLAFAILYILIAFSVISWLFALKNRWQERRYYKVLEEDMAWQIKRAKERGIPSDSVHFDSEGNMRYNDTNEIVE